MKKLSAILVMVLVLAMTVVTVSAASVNFTLTASSATVNPGDTFTITITHNSTVDPNGINFSINYDNTKVSYTGGESVQGLTVGDNTTFIKANGLVAVGAMDPSNDWTFTFTAKEGVSGDAVFTIKEIAEAWGTDDEDYVIGTLTGTTVKIGSSEPDPEPAVFAVKANLDTAGKVVVTAENIGENAGTVYVATYNEGVLVDCEAKALADIADGWTVENLDGTAADAQIFVWNDQNVPLFDNVITVSAE